MKLTINGTTYTKIKSLSFAPEVDLTANTVPANEFTAEIVTDDTIPLNKYAHLYDDLDNLWASYPVIFSEISAAGVRTIKAMSSIGRLENKTLPSAFYSGVSAATIIGSLPGGYTYGIATAFLNATITGYFPEQSARERLHWILFVLGGYVQDFFQSTISIRALGNTKTLVPASKTYWKPKVSYKDYVTAIKVRAYTYTLVQPENISTTDKWVSPERAYSPTSDGSWVTYTSDAYYTVTYRDFTLTNTNAPSGIPDNVVSIDDVTIVNEDNVSAILSRLSDVYFNRGEIEADIINNREYCPGMGLQIYKEPNEIVGGFVQGCTFAFGNQVKSAIKLVIVEDVNSAKLMILYMWGDLQVGKTVYSLPVGSTYEIDNQYIDAIIDGHRYIFRPENATVSGTMVAGGVTDEEDCVVALDHYDGVLSVVSVDSLSDDGEGVVAIG